MQIVVARATRRRQLLRKDFGMHPVKLIQAPPTPIQPAFAVKQPAFSVKRQRRRANLPGNKQQDRRKLAATACDEATSDATFGDINFDCRFTFVQVWLFEVPGSCCVQLYCLAGHTGFFRGGNGAPAASALLEGSVVLALAWTIEHHKQVKAVYFAESLTASRGYLSLASVPAMQEKTRLALHVTILPLGGQ